MAKRQQQIDPADVVRAIVACRPCHADVAAIRQALGTTAARSLADVSRAFGAAYSTVTQSWRPNGMPGDSTAKHYPWADILVWWIERNLSAERVRTASSALSEEERRELARIELDSARADLEMRQTKLSREKGQYMAVDMALSIMRAALNLTRDALMGLPAKFKPRFPARYADEWAGDMERELRNILTGLGETSAAEMVEHCKAAHDELRSEYSQTGRASDEN